MSTNFELVAEPREAKGTGPNRRLRRAGKVPAVLYGAGKDTVNLVLDHDKIFHNLENEAFHSSILTVKMGKGSEQAILRAVQVHSVRRHVLHVDLQRITASQKLNMKVPLHFVGEDVAPGVKQEGGIVSHLINEVAVSCLPSQLPEYLEIDLTAVHLNESVHLSDIKLPEGVDITGLSHEGDDLAVATIVIVRGAVEEEEVEVEEAEAEAEVAEGEAGAETAGEKGGE